MKLNCFITWVVSIIPEHFLFRIVTLECFLAISLYTFWGNWAPKYRSDNSQKWARTHKRGITQSSEETMAYVNNSFTVVEGIDQHGQFVSIINLKGDGNWSWLDQVLKKLDFKFFIYHLTCRPEKLESMGKY